MTVNPALLTTPRSGNPSRDSCDPVGVVSHRHSSSLIESTSAPWVILVINVNISLVGLILLSSMF